MCMSECWDARGRGERGMRGLARVISQSQRELGSKKRETKDPRAISRHMGGITET